MSAGKHLLALCGGVGGAKLAHGLAMVLPPERLTVAVNTGDDFTHLGLSISPDIDTVIYTMADLADRQRGWGLAGESWHFMDALRSLGGEGWFNLGDRDLATHVERTRRLAEGASLSEATAALARAQGIATRILPMSDDTVATVLETEIGTLAFQHYFVREQCRPQVSSIRFDGADNAGIQSDLAALLASGDLGGIVICPSNPWLSIAPILAVPGIVEALRDAAVPIIAVSPIIGGKAIKGPTAKLMAELGHSVDQGTVAAYYRGVADILLLDHKDEGEAGLVAAVGIDPRFGATLMRDDADRAALAKRVLELLGMTA